MRRQTFNSRLTRVFINARNIEAWQNNNNHQFAQRNCNRHKFIRFNQIKSNLSLSFKKIKFYFNLFVRLIIIACCLCGFITQASDLTINYFKFDTVVKIKYETEYESVLPAITVCFPFFVTWDQLKIKYPQFEHHVNLALEKIHQFKKIQASNQDNTEIDPILIDGQEINPSDIFHYFQNKSFDENSFLEMFNMSIPKGFYSLGRLYKTIDGTIITRNKESNYLSKINNNPRESLSIDDLGQYRKCFSIYTSKEIDDNRINIQSIKLIVNLNKNWLKKEFLTKDDYLFQLHKPSFIPRPNEGLFIRLKPNQDYVVLFQRIKKHLLKRPYKTNCKQYKNDPSNKDMCLISCVNRIGKQVCGNCVQRYNLLVKDFYQTNKQPKFCNFTHLQCGRENWLKEAQSQCELECLPDCYSEYYEFYETSDREIKNWRDKSVSRTIIRLIHKTIPDVEIKHFPEVTLSSYVASIGGLAGMWLGFSMIALYDWMVIFMKKIKIKFKQQYKTSKKKIILNHPKCY